MRSVISVFAIVAAALVLLPDAALARGGGSGARGFAPHGFARVHARTFGKSFGPGLRLRRGVVHRHHAGRHQRRDLIQWPWLFGAGVYGVADDASAVLGPFPLALTGPPCRLQTVTEQVAASGGGEREITVTRCLRPLDIATPPSDKGPARDIITSSVAAEPGTAMAPTSMPAEAVEAGPFGRRACAVRASIVPSEDGGVRTVTVHRC